MRKFGFWFEVVVKDDERAFLARDGRFVRLLQPGRFTAFDPGRHLTVEIVKVVRAEIAPEKALLLQKTHRPVADQNFEIVHAGPNEVAIVSFDGEPKHLVLPNTTRAFWKTLTEVERGAHRHDVGAAHRQAPPRQARHGARRRASSCRRWWRRTRRAS